MGRGNGTSDHKGRPLRATAGGTRICVWTHPENSPPAGNGKPPRNGSAKWYRYELTPPSITPRYSFVEPLDSRVRGLRRGDSAAGVLRALSAELEAQEEGLPKRFRIHGSDA